MDGNLDLQNFQPVEFSVTSQIKKSDNSSPQRMKTTLIKPETNINRTKGKMIKNVIRLRMPSLSQVFDKN